MLRSAWMRAILRKLQVRVIYAIIVTVAAGAFVAATDNTYSQTTRFRVIVGVVVFQTAAILMLIHKLFDLLAALRSVHRASSYVNTIRGLWATLELGIEAGGLSPEVRRAIYRAGDEQFNLYDREMGGNGWH